MLNDAELNQYWEDHQTDDEWRKVSYRGIANLLEACSECGSVRAKERLVRCPWCEDTYCCKDQICSEQHRSGLHPAVAYWTW
ncbi:MAG TPA: hypothetical protein VI455_18160 [Terriglobia bacterium]